MNEKEALGTWLAKYFNDIDLVALKPEFFSLPFDKIGNEIISAFKLNLKTLDSFLQKIVDFNYFQFYFKEIKTELSELHPNLGHSTSLKELKTILSNSYINLNLILLIS